MKRYYRSYCFLAKKRPTLNLIGLPRLFLYEEKLLHKSFRESEGAWWDLKRLFSAVRSPETLWKQRAALEDEWPREQQEATVKEVEEVGVFTGETMANNHHIVQEMQEPISWEPWKKSLCGAHKCLLLSSNSWDISLKTHHKSDLMVAQEKKSGDH